MTVTSPADGIERRVGYHRLAEYPLYVSAGLETSAIRARWLSTMSQHLVFGLPATALLFTFLALALRRTQNLHEEAARREEAEMSVLRGFLPAAMSDQELEAEVRAVIAEVKPDGPKGFGLVMKAATARLAGRADGNHVAAVARRLLGS